MRGRLADAGLRSDYAHMVAMVCDEALNRLWRLHKADTNWQLIYIGFQEKEPPLFIEYPTYESLPKWVKERRAILRMLEVDDDNSTVYGVGKRVSEETYWVVEPIGVETDGGNA